MVPLGQFNTFRVKMLQYTTDMIYLDNNATTRALPEVVEALVPYLGEQYANPSSIHQFGQAARHAVECARVKVAELIGAKPTEITFTGGGTESINLAIRGALALRPDRRRIVTTAVEHSAVLRVVERLADEGYDVQYVGVDSEGRLDEAAWQEKLTPDTALASIIHANNETGVIFDVERLGRVATDRGIPLHVDAVQSIGKVSLDVTTWPAQLVSFAAHKFHGPKGVGAVIVGRGARIQPQVLGGHQERGLRAGTENVLGIVGTGAAMALAVEHLEEEQTRVRAMRDRLEEGLLAKVSIARVNGDREARLPNTTNLGFTGLEAEAILMLLSKHEVCVSSGSACSSGSLEPSHVLRAMGVDLAIAHGAVRFSLSRFTTDDEIARTLDIVPAVVERLQALLPRPVE